jgi:hypothetical protein
MIKQLTESLPYNLKKNFIKNCQNIKNDLAFLFDRHPKKYLWIQDKEWIYELLCLGLFYRTIIAPLSAGSNFFNYPKLHSNQNKHFNAIEIGKSTMVQNDFDQIDELVNSFDNIAGAFGLSKYFLNESDTSKSLFILMQMSERGHNGL